MPTSNNPEVDLSHTTKDVHDLLEDSQETLCDLEGRLKQYTDEVIQMVKQKPLSALLVAGGIGFILSSLLKK